MQKVKSGVTICILLSTYNGEKYIEEQLNSLLEQEGVEISILVRDDGSNDRTTEILSKWQTEGKLKWYSGENLRSARSFLNLLQTAPDCDFYAFCDQDDVWDCDKLKIAISKLSGLKNPALYCSNTMLVDYDLNEIGCSKKINRFNFIASLISNPVTGCTAVFNKELKDLACLFTPSYIDMHDWWIYRICMAVGGVLVFDEQPHIRYRQHGGNVIGGLVSSADIRKRHINALKRHGDGPRFRVIKELYYGYVHILPRDNAEILELAFSYKKSWRYKLKWLYKGTNAIGGFRNKRNFALAVLLNKF